MLLPNLGHRNRKTLYGASMAHISVRDVALEFQILDGTRNRLFHPSALKIMLGGKLGVRGGNRIIVTALENINLELTEGTRLGILGHNGAGKSTLLRLLAGIYHPTRGTVSSAGRISPMFDISLGMDMDMTGYENIRMQGLFFGMSPQEIEDTLPEISEFTQLEDYLELPVRTYSAGMMARLSFAIATAKMPEILLLDEVIGAGDAAFIERAQNRLAQYVESAKILVLASHSEAVIQQFCTTAIVMQKGNVIFRGSTDEATATYQECIHAVPRGP
tara:strand:+ start:155 stop:979 length:825 start_codon:yes stop_codon:yes gene_type:complete